MKKWCWLMISAIAIFTALSKMSFASEIVCYNTTTNRVKEYSKSANTAEYLARTDCLINPNLDLIRAVPQEWWIQDTGSIREMTQVEKDQLATEKLNADIAARTTMVTTVNTYGSTPPIWSYKDGEANLTQGTLKQGGTPVALQGASGVPSGAILLLLAGPCPTGYTEMASMAGKTLLGTLNANGDGGTVGGSDTVTPTFTGTPFTSIINHTHPVAVTDPGHSHTERYFPTATGGSNGNTADTSMSGTITNTSLTTTTNSTGITASSANPSGGVSSITPTGTISAIDNRSAFVKVIFCRKD